MNEPRQTLAPLLNGEAAAYRVLNSAIEAMDETMTASPERAMPSGAESDRFAQADIEQHATPQTVGGHVDLLA